MANKKTTVVTICITNDHFAEWRPDAITDLSVGLVTNRNMATALMLIASAITINVWHHQKKLAQ